MINTNSQISKDVSSYITLIKYFRDFTQLLKTCASYIEPFTLIQLGNKIKGQ